MFFLSILFKERYTKSLNLQAAAGLFKMVGPAAPLL